MKFSIRRSVIRELMRIFSVTQSRTFEYELYRELQEELAFENFPGRYERPVLQQSEANRIRTKYRWTLVFERPREEYEGFDVSINRFFEIDVPQKIRKKLREAGKVIFIPTAREMRQGEMKRDGEIIQISRKARMFHAFQKGRLRNFEKIADEWKK